VDLSHDQSCQYRIQIYTDATNHPRRRLVKGNIFIYSNVLKHIIQLPFRFISHHTKIFHIVKVKGKAIPVIGCGGP
jgi:hypothetical protein